MTDIVLVALITTVPSTLAAVGALLSLRQSRKNHTLVNSRMTELLNVTRGEANLEGQEQGRVKEVGRKRDN